MFSKIDCVGSHWVVRVRFFILIMLAILAGCQSPPPAPDTTTNVGSTKSFPTAGLSPLDQGQYENALNLLQKNELKKAEKILQKLSNKYAGHVGVKQNLAVTHYKSNNFKAAKKICEQALAIDSKTPEIHNLLGLISVETNQYNQAEEQYLRAISLDQSYANALYNLALLYDIYYQDIPKAFKYYGEYLALVPDDSETKDWLDQLKYSLDLN